MDIKRSNGSSRKKRRQYLLGGSIVGLLLVLLGISFFLRPAAPKVDRDSVWIGDVRRGPLEVKVRGIGSFVPEDQRWVTAQTAGNVDRIRLLPGAEVQPDSVILDLSNPELQQNLRNAELELASTKARLANERAREEDALLEMEFQLAQLEANFQNAALDVTVDQELFDEGLVAERDLLRSKVAKEQWGRQRDILQRRLERRRSQIDQNLAPAIAAVSQQEERYALFQRQVEDLQVKAGIHGILQRLPLQEGEQVAPGTQLAQVSDPSRLKAVIRVPETQAKDLAIGQSAVIDNRNGKVAGEVARIDPAVEAGQVNVDLRISAPLPPGARADQTVEGHIQLENLPDVLFLARPAAARENQTVALFVLAENGTEAFRREVSFGRSSVSEIEVRGGLRPGDRVILSDTSQWDGHDQLRLN